LFRTKIGQYEKKQPRQLLAGVGNDVLCSADMPLTLGELEATASAALAVLLTLLHAAAAGAEPTVTPGVIILRVGCLQRPGDTEHNGAGLAGDAAAADVHKDVHLAIGVGAFEGGDGIQAVFIFGEKDLQRAVIHLEL